MKKRLATIMSVLLLATTMVGCGDASNGGDGGKNDGTTTAVGTTTTTEASATTTTTAQNQDGGEQEENEPKALFELMDLSLYNVEEGSRNEYDDNTVWESTSYTTQGRKELDSLPAILAEDTPIQLGQTTVQDLLDAGWSFYDSDTEKTAVSSHVQVPCTLYHKDGSALNVNAWNHTKEEQALAGCIVSKVDFSYDKYALGKEFVSFTVGDMTKEAASYEAVKEVFGDFHRVSVNCCYQNGVYQSSNVTIHYDWQIDGEDCTVEFRFEDTAEGLKVGGFLLQNY